MTETPFIRTHGAKLRIQKIVNGISSGVPVLLEGPTGTSKTRSAIEACNELGQQYILFNFSSQTTIEDLMGRMAHDPSNFGGFDYKEGPYVDAYKNGILTSTTLLTNTPGLEHAIELSHQYPGLKIGLHLNIALGKPLTDGKSLVGENGEFIKPRNLDPNHIYDEKEVFDEIEAQYNKFISLMKKKPTHFDSHLFTTD